MPARARLLTAMIGLLAAATLLVGCGGDSSDTPDASSSSDVKTITLTIAAGKVDPQLGEVDVSPGQKVSLTVTSDVADGVHAHTGGDGVELELEPNKAATVELTAPTVPGVYEVETHESGLLLFNLTVR